MEIHNNQSQHIVPQVYLKQFGYELKGNVWWVSIAEKGKLVTTNIKIVDFLNETNVFDFPYEDINDKRHFEYKSNILESRYRTIISNLIYQKRLTDKDRDVLSHFVPNLLCRTAPFRNFIYDVLIDNKKLEYFIKEITMFVGDYNEIKEIFDILPNELKLNFAIGPLMNHLVRVFRNFNKIIVKDYNNIGWCTTDNSVVFDRKGFFDYIIPIEAEIHLPLSKDFCLIMYHNSMTNLKKDNLNYLSFSETRINHITLDFFEEINFKIANNMNKYLIFPCQIDKTDLDK